MTKLATASEWRSFIEGRFGPKKPIHMTVEEISLMVLVDILDVLERRTRALPYASVSQEG